MQKRIPVALLTSTALLTVPATSHALAGAPDQACYSHSVRTGQDPLTEQVTQPINVSLTGGTPGGRFQVALSRPKGSLGGMGSISGDFDAAGNGVGTITNVYPNPGSIEALKGQKILITASDYTAGISDQPIGETKITNLVTSVNTKPRNSRKARKIRVSGTPLAGKKLYGFVTNKSGRQVLDRFKIGKANVCGFAKTKAVVAPSPFRYGKFRLYVNGGKKINRRAAIISGFSITRSLF